MPLSGYRLIAYRDSDMNDVGFVWVNPNDENISPMLPDEESATNWMIDHYMNAKKVADLTTKTLTKMMKQRKYSLTCEISDEFEFKGGAVPFDMRLNRDNIVTANVISDTMESATVQVEKYFPVIRWIDKKQL
jgi:hypothetical protein